MDTRAVKKKKKHGVPERKIQGTVKVLYMYKKFVCSYAFLNVKIQRSRNHFGVA